MQQGGLVGSAATISSRGNECFCQKPELSDGSWQSLKAHKGPPDPDAVEVLIGERIEGDINEKQLIRIPKRLLLSNMVLQTMLSGEYREASNERIEICDMEPDTFLRMIRHLNGETIELKSSDEALNLLYGAFKYLIFGLARQCLDYLYENVSPRNVLAIWNHVRVYARQSHALAEEEVSCGSNCCCSGDSRRANWQSATSAELKRLKSERRKLNGDAKTSCSPRTSASAVFENKSNEIRNVSSNSKLVKGKANARPPNPETPPNSQEQAAAFGGFSDALERVRHHPCERRLSKCNAEMRLLDTSAPASSDEAFDFATVSRPLERKCLTIIDANARQILAQPMQQLTLDGLTDILKRDSLELRPDEEILVFKALEKWVSANAQEAGEPLTVESLRKTIGSTAFLVRYLLMSTDAFLAGPAKSSLPLLTPDEAATITAYLMGHRLSPDCPKSLKAHLSTMRQPRGASHSTVAVTSVPSRMWELAGRLIRGNCCNRLTCCRKVVGNPLQPPGKSCCCPCFKSKCKLTGPCFLEHLCVFLACIIE